MDAKERKVVFQEWLSRRIQNSGKARGKTLNDSTVTSYVGAVDNAQRKFGLEYNFFDYSESTKFVEVWSALSKTQEYQTRQKTENNQTHAALSQYRDFLAETNGSTSELSYINIYADKVDSNIDGFKFDWSYISGGGKKKSPTYLNLEKAIFISGQQEIQRKYEKREEQKSGLVLARLAIQVFEVKLDGLTEDERRNMKTDGTSNSIGFWNNSAQLVQQWGNGANAGRKPSAEYVADMYLGNAYPSNSKAKYYFYNAGLYDSIIMAQNLLKKFGASGDHFKVIVWQSNGSTNEDGIQIADGANESTAHAVVDYTFDGIAENIIFYGVPGSGKSFSIKNAIREIVRKNGSPLTDVEYIDFEKMNTVRIVFHPDYTYSDFAGQILPTSIGGKVTYEFTLGPFTRIFSLARKQENEPFFLIIEEINRGNAAAIFGDVFQLLDRTDDGIGEYGIKNTDIAKKVFGENKEDEEIRLPKNLWIFATMNTSDQNVFTLDTAFQRRFEPQLIKNEFSTDQEFEIEGTGVTWRVFAEKINGILAKQDAVVSSEDKSLGAWFIKSKKDGDVYKPISKTKFANKVLKYLWDDAFKFARNEIFDISENRNTLQKTIATFEEHGFDGIFKESTGIKNILVSGTTSANSTGDN